MDYEKFKKLRDIGFNKAVGLSAVEVREGYAKVELEIRPEHMNPIGSVHGGVYFTLADNAGGAAASSRGRYVTTLSGDINYLRPGLDCKKLIAETREIKTGKLVCVYDVTITDETGKELAVARMTYHYLEKVRGGDFLTQSGKQ